MADKDVENEVVADDDEVIVDEAGQGAERPGDTSGDDPAALKAALTEARQKAEMAATELAEERAKRERDTRNVNAELSDSRLQTIANAMDATAAQIKDAQAKRRAALEAADWDAEASASDELMALKVKQSRLSEGKTVLEQQIEQAKQAPNDPVDRYTHNMAPRAQTWIRSHREVVTDPVKNAELERAHFRALGAGIREGSDDYFAHMDREMGYAPRQSERAAQDDGARGDDRRGALAAPAAPPSRDVPSSATGQSRPNTIRLSAAEREAADMAGMSYVDYAKERDRLRAIGSFITH